MKPVIGITPSPTVDEHRGERNTLSINYSDAVLAAGGVPIILPPQTGNDDEILSIVDGIIFSGGGDIRPEIYGDHDYHPKTYGIHDRRDNLELPLIREAIARDVPVLCICRGIQILNVALGGTLYQDVADQFDPEIKHSQSDLSIPASEPSHQVQLTPGSLAATVYASETVQTNSFHHQSLKDIPAELVVVGRAPDGTIEAVERPGSHFVLGVQWHPEMMFKANNLHLKPFASLIEAAKRADVAKVAAD